MKEVITGAPDDMHFHPRKGLMLKNVLRYTSSVFARGVVMGNLPSPILTADDAMRYKREILSVDPSFNPLMTIMLRKETTPKMIRDARKAGIMFVKYMPGDSTTNSQGGIPLPELLSEYGNLLSEIRDCRMFLLGHWTLPIAGQTIIQELEEERRAIPYLAEIVEAFPGLRITVEHISTAQMVEFVISAPDDVVATITSHHPACDIRDLADQLLSKINNPDYYCKPILNAHLDSLAVREAMLSGSQKFFFGSDSAPHLVCAKRRDPPAAGIFSAPVALPLICQIFERADKLGMLDDFVSCFGAEAYCLPYNEGIVSLQKNPWIVPHEIEGIGAFYGGKTIDWCVK